MRVHLLFSERERAREHMNAPSQQPAGSAQVLSRGPARPAAPPPSHLRRHRAPLLRLLAGRRPRVTLLPALPESRDSLARQPLTSGRERRCLRLRRALTSDSRGARSGGPRNFRLLPRPAPPPSRPRPHQATPTDPASHRMLSAWAGWGDGAGQARATPENAGWRVSPGVAPGVFARS